MYLFVGMIILVILVVWVILYIASGIFEFIKGLISRKNNKNYPKRSFHQKIAMLLTPTVNVVSDDVYYQNHMLNHEIKELKKELNALKNKNV